ncbi:hypothetical protein HK413_02635 [Mucilaginibacter sp. S1162]|uniref:Uncharacterized protein n=1 Tax=Mucilaginibacter humi TaxID=2732510 RepID=A0ABX1VZF8_9SPHI|nr:hypothetical protein [Mucilaginibacter humi]NNU33332.1 hypothetical protein [Mucilaginibacter humi]
MADFETRREEAERSAHATESAINSIDKSLTRQTASMWRVAKWQRPKSY